ncbi:MAG: hypothetical protein MJE68_22450, partial [Proteobacteria bacterium]|nr:hypothetical protein [Pseudomonadota bacterium]
MVGVGATTLTTIAMPSPAEAQISAVTMRGPGLSTESRSEDNGTLEYSVRRISGSGSLEVKVQITQTGNYIGSITGGGTGTPVADGAFNVTVTFSGTGTQVFGIILSDDSVMEADGGIVVTIPDQTGISYPGEVFRVTLTDNDAVTLPSVVGVTQEVRGDGFSDAAFNTWRVADILYEGTDEYIAFTVIRNNTSESHNTTFEYQVTQTGDWLASNVTTGTTLTGMIGRNRVAEEVRLYIDNDTVAEDRGSVTFTLIDNTTNTTAAVVQNAKSHTVVVVDDDRPEVAIMRATVLTQTDPSFCTEPGDSINVACRARLRDEARGTGASGDVNEASGNHLFGIAVRPIGTVVDVTVRVSRNGPIFADLPQAERVTTHVISLNGTGAFTSLGADMYRHAPEYANASSRLAALNVSIPDNMRYDGEDNNITVEIIDTGDAYNTWGDGRNTNEITTEHAPPHGSYTFVRVADDDSQPVIDIARTAGDGLRLGESDIGDRNATFDSDIEISINGTSALAGSFRLQFANATSANATGGDSCATAGVDFINPSATINVPVGTTSVMFDASPYICDDGVVDTHGVGALEKFNIVIDEVQNLTVASGNFNAASGVYTNKVAASIIDLDPEMSVVANMTSVQEGENVTFSFRTPKGVPIYHGLNVLPVVWTGNSSVNATQTTLIDAITFTNGTEEQNVSVATNFVEGINAADPISVMISYPTLANHLTGEYYWVNATGQTATVQVVDTSLGVTLTPVTQDVVEGNMAQLNISVTGASRTSSLDVVVTTQNISSVAGVDYVSVNETLSFAVGETMKTINVTTRENGVAGDPIRVLNVTAVAIVNATANITRMAEVRIVDSGVGVTLTPRVEVMEGETARLEISAPAGASRTSDLEVLVTTQDVSARAGADYTALNETVTIPAGQTMGEITVRTLDNVVAGDGVRVLNVTAIAMVDDATNVTLMAEVAIADNDASPMVSVR